MSPYLLKHPLSLQTLDIQPIVPVIDAFVDNFSKKRPNTRATELEIEHGNDLVISSTIEDAHKFVIRAHDDLELVDYVIKNDACKLWHSSDLQSSSMLFRAISAILASFSRQSVTPEWLTQHNDEVHFLGFASAYTKKSSTTVLAFEIHSFVLYDFDATANITNIRCVSTDVSLSRSTMQDRLMQILQVIQGIHKKSTRFTYSITNPDTKEKSSLSVADETGCKVTSARSRTKCVWTVLRDNVIPMCQCTMRVIWKNMQALLQVLLQTT